MENLTIANYPDDVVYVEVHNGDLRRYRYVCIVAESDGDKVHVHVDLDRLVRALREGGADL